MKVKWLGHACFLITSEEGIRIITDPYVPGWSDVNYGKIEEVADIVTVSHDHRDHNNVAGIKGSPTLVKGVGTKQVKGIEFQGLSSYHDTVKGRQRGPNTIFCFAVNGVKICHLGDLGHQLSDEQLAEIGEVDLLLIPTGGGPTIDPAGATQVCERIKPRVAIPMHFKTSKCTFPPAGAEDFVKGKANVRRMDTSEVQFKKDELPAATEVVVLKHAL